MSSGRHLVGVGDLYTVDFLVAAWTLSTRADNLS